jgi:bacterial/archaeal transporter family protein
MWPFYALFSAIAAAFVAIFATLALKDIAPTLATSLRSLVMAALPVVIATALGKFKHFSLSD